MDPIIRAIHKGFVIGNHAYSHNRFSTLSFDECVNEILKTEKLIDKAYKHANMARPGKYFRFPHLDRGCGGWVVDYELVEEEYRSSLINLFSDGLNISLSPPHEEQKEKKAQLQEFLKNSGFSVPFEGITIPWYAHSEMRHAIDCLMTFSTSDWMLSKRHKGKWAYKSMSELKDKIANDDALSDSSSSHIVLLHDQDDLFEITVDLLDHFVDKGYVFLDI
jgi:peptidoglycan/xylan/chitin deacetylase (PgdA/CDA1 family)